MGNVILSLYTKNMLNKKQIAVGVIVVILIITGGAFGYIYGTKVAVIKNVPEVKTDTQVTQKKVTTENSEVIPSTGSQKNQEPVPQLDSKTDALLGTWVPVEKLAGRETLEDTFSIENGKHVYKTVINGKVYTGTWGVNEGTLGVLFWARYESLTDIGERYVISLAIDIDSKTGELIYYGEGADPDTMRWKKVK